MTKNEETKYVGEKITFGSNPKESDSLRSHKHSQHRQQVPFPNHFLSSWQCAVRPPSCLLHDTFRLFIFSNHMFCTRRHRLHYLCIFLWAHIRFTSFPVHHYLGCSSPLCMQLLVTPPCPQHTPSACPGWQNKHIYASLLYVLCFHASII